MSVWFSLGIQADVFMSNNGVQATPMMNSIGIISKLLTDDKESNSSSDDEVLAPERPDPWDIIPTHLARPQIFPITLPRQNQNDP